jgi:tetratricopeptide (TPR) repeat protein
MAAVPGYLTDEEFKEVGKEDDWSAKDNLFHALVWATRRLDMLKTISAGDSWIDVDYGDFEDANREIFKEYRDKSWEDMREMSSTTYQDGLAYLASIDESELQRKKDNDERPFWRIIADNFITHPMIHIWEILQDAGQTEDLIDIFGEKFTKMLRKLDSSDNWQGLIDYNYACILSLSGDYNKAIKSLKNSLELNPQLIEWSQQDPDLEPLRNLEDYQALYKD